MVKRHRLNFIILNHNICPGPLGGSGLERVHVQVPGVRASESPAPGLPETRGHLRPGGGHRPGETPQRLPTQIRIST